MIAINIGRKVSNLLFADDMGLYLENMRKSVENHLETAEEFNKGAIYKIKI